MLLPLQGVSGRRHEPFFTSQYVNERSGLKGIPSSNLRVEGVPGKLELPGRAAGQYAEYPIPAAPLPLFQKIEKKMPDPKVRQL